MVSGESPPVVCMFSQASCLGRRCCSTRAATVFFSGQRYPKLWRIHVHHPAREHRLPTESLNWFEPGAGRLRRHLTYMKRRLMDTEIVYVRLTFDALTAWENI
jgi:hypothetical protein